MNIRISIDVSFGENLLMVDGEDFEFSFKSLADYDKFMQKKLKVNTYNADGYEISSTAAERLEEIYENPKALENLPINITILSLSQMKYLKGANHALLIDITNLTVKDAITLLNADSWEIHRFYDKYNTLHASTKEELLRAYGKIEAIAQRIKKENLSPLETLMFVFDYTRQRIYTLSQDKDVSKSRDLAHILEEKEIVCKGYANIFCSLCEFLDIKADVVLWKPTNFGNGHASVIAFVNDPKYDVHVVYAFDPTWGAKKSDDDTNYLYSYKQALIPIEKEIRYKEDKNLESNDFKTLGLLQTRFNSYESFVELRAPQVIVNDSKKNVLSGINTIRKLIGKDAIAEDRIDEIYTLYQELKSTFENTMPMETFERLMRNVRAFENRLDPDVYPLDEHTITLIKINSQSYRPREDIEVPIELLRKIFGK